MSLSCERKVAQTYGGGSTFEGEVLAQEEGVPEQAVSPLKSNGPKVQEDNQSMRPWLRPEIERTLVDDGPENIAGCQNADQMTGAVEDRNSTYVLL